MTNARVLDDAPWFKSGPAVRVLELLNGNGEEARVVGGAVRNALLKIPTGDIDIATTAVPDEVIRRAKAAGIKSVPTGIEHGTVTLVVDAQPFEVTTLREDTETFGRKAKVAFGRDWVRDAERRDFWMMSSPNGCASSAIRASVSPKTICASPGFSAFTPPMAPVSPIAPATLPASRREQALRPSPPNACAWKC